MSKQIDQRVSMTMKCFLVCAAWLTPGLHGEAFSSPYSTKETKQQHERLPTDDIWWTVNGPDMRWNFKNLHQLFPTVTVYRSGPVKKLKSNTNPEIAAFPVSTPNGQLPFSEFIKSEFSTTMGVVILHKGQIAFESYPRMKAHEKPIYWSVAKSLVGTLVRILEERGLVDVSKPIDSYLPDLKDTSLEGTPIRHLLDMASGLDCADDYENKEVDKDILITGNRVYGPDTCLMVRPIVNGWFKPHLDYGDLPRGVSWNNGWKKGKSPKPYRAQITPIKTGKRTGLGYYDTIEEASAVFEEARKEQMKILIETEIDLKVKNAIMECNFK